jgi:hypothetical protein
VKIKQNCKIKIKEIEIERTIKYKGKMEKIKIV